MKKANTAGFTLIEIIVVIACIALLAGIIAPLAFQAIEDARISRAQADVHAIASAVSQLQADTGRWPIYDGPDQTNPTILSLVSTTTGDLTNNTWTEATGGLPSVTEPLEWHLVANGDVVNSSPRYHDDCDVYPNCWRGPYIQNIGLDPWGNSYVIYTGGWHGTPPTQLGLTWDKAWVVCAGPDRKLQTNCGTPGDEQEQADDIGKRMR
jgi:prepilin-type N-terminal cleavage/methylation domain-containing protein